MKSKTHLGGWAKTTLWLRIPLGPKINVDVWYPQGTSQNEQDELTAKNAAQGVDIIRNLTGSRKMIIQGQFISGHEQRGYNTHLRKRCKNILKTRRNRCVLNRRSKNKEVIAARLESNRLTRAVIENKRW